MDVREKLVEIIQNSVGGCARHWANVLVYRPNMAMKILVDTYDGYYGDDDEEWYEGWALYGGDTHGNPVITHWAYLPRPPKGE